MTATERCFSEPGEDDPSPWTGDEHRAAFLKRSTSILAVQLRDFYNRNLRELPDEAATRLCRGLHGDPTMARHFELVVGRLLQLAGALRLEYEASGAEGRQVDWLAEFEDGVVSVEATVPAANAAIAKERAAVASAVRMVVGEAPKGWWVFISAVPRFGPNESKQAFRRALREAFAGAPSVHADRWSFERMFPGGRLKLSLLAASDPAAPARWASGPAVGFQDDTTSVVMAAINGKRRQARGATKPVLAALCTYGGPYDVEQFDRALLGGMDWDVDTGTIRFDPNGVFSPTPAGKEPTFAGALVFTGLGMFGGPDPILYKHPRFHGTLPRSLAGLRQRFLGTEGIEEAAPGRDGLLQGLGWPTG